MGDDSFECLSSGSDDSWDILSNSESDKECDLTTFVSPRLNCRSKVCASCGDLLSDEFLQCLFCKSCYICMKCKTKVLHSMKCSNTSGDGHSFSVQSRCGSCENISNCQNCEADILSLPENENASSSFHENFTHIDNWVESSSNTELFTSNFSSIKNEVDVENISSNSADEYEQPHEKSTIQLSPGDSSILPTLLQFLQNSNGPIVSATESSLFESKIPKSTAELALLPKPTFQQPHTAVHNVLMHMDDSSAFQSWFSLGSTLVNTHPKRESLTSHSSSSSLSESNNESMLQQDLPSPSLTPTSPLAGITAGLFTTTKTVALKKESSGGNVSNRSSPTSDFSPQSSISSLSSSPLGAATQFLKSVVKYSAAALNNFDLLSLDQTDDLPVDNWTKLSTGNKKLTIECDSTHQKNLSSPTCLSIFKKSVKMNDLINNTKGIAVKGSVWDSEHLREVINPKSLPSSIAETTAYNLR
ncbi:unnamed protein product [Heterobilharzia americana]|nr:unnamed protein product [Heterobilharzia americana]CAH8600621.1 unnamed protein product [Heterobilharzia americana]